MLMHDLLKSVRRDSFSDHVHIQLLRSAILALPEVHVLLIVAGSALNVFDLIDVVIIPHHDHVLPLGPPLAPVQALRRCERDAQIHTLFISHQPKFDGLSRLMLPDRLEQGIGVLHLLLTHLCDAITCLKTGLCCWATLNEATNYGLLRVEVDTEHRAISL